MDKPEKKSIREKAHLYLENYEKINRVFEKYFGYNLYFIGGTLLGYIRENDFLEHDKDMDVSYFSKYEHVADVRNEMIEICEKLLEIGEPIVFIRSNFSTVKYFIKYRINMDDRIDIMPSWQQGGRIYRPTFVGYEGTKDIILPLRDAKFYGHNILIPNQPEVKLAHVYGDNWRIPDKRFKKKDMPDMKTIKIVNEQLYYGDECRRLVKKSVQWKEYSLLMKFFINIILMRRHGLFSKIFPKKGKYKRAFLKRINVTGKKGLKYGKE